MSNNIQREGYSRQEAGGVGDPGHSTRMISGHRDASMTSESDGHP
jgi:hypothetical protein